MRVCHPGPVALHCSITSAGNLNEIDLRGLADRGLPPLFTVARAIISSVSSGSSRYSLRFTTCASTRIRSDFKERRDARLLAFIGFPHAKNVTITSTLCIADDHHTAGEPPEADDALLAVVSPGIFKFQSYTAKDNRGIGEIEPARCQSPGPLHRIEGDSHQVIVYTLTRQNKGFHQFDERR